MESVLCAFHPLVFCVAEIIMKTALTNVLIAPYSTERLSSIFF